MDKEGPVVGHSSFFSSVFLSLFLLSFFLLPSRNLLCCFFLDFVVIMSDDGLSVSVEYAKSGRARVCCFFLSLSLSFLFLYIPPFFFFLTCHCSVGNVVG